MLFSQFLYDRDSRGADLRQGCFVALGTWHIYKQASIELHKMASRYFLCGLFHALFPSVAFKLYKRLTEISWLFLIIHLAYPKFRGHLVSARRRTPPESSRGRLLHCLHLLCEYYIPTVPICFTSLSRCLSMDVPSERITRLIYLRVSVGSSSSL